MLAPPPAMVDKNLGVSLSRPPPIGEIICCLVARASSNGIIDSLNLHGYHSRYHHLYSGDDGLLRLLLLFIQLFYLRLNPHLHLDLSLHLQLLLLNNFRSMEQAVV